MNRRIFLASAALMQAAPSAPGLAGSNRTHLFVKPAFKEKFVWYFSTLLGCGTAMSLKAPGLAEPILAWRFPGGGALSVEFTDAALDEEQAGRGAWLELWAAEPEALKKTILEAGLKQVRYPATNTFYFAAPGGQIFGIVAASNPGGGEMKIKP
jgi:hypothetical protein